MKKKNIPLRKCISCSERKPKDELVRVVKNKLGEVDIDLGGKANGRGAYLCKDLECIDQAEKTNRLSSALKTKVSEDLYEKLRQLID